MIVHHPQEVSRVTVKIEKDTLTFKTRIIVINRLVIILIAGKEQRTGTLQNPSFVSMTQERKLTVCHTHYTL